LERYCEEYIVVETKVDIVEEVVEKVVEKVEEGVDKFEEPTVESCKFFDIDHLFYFFPFIKTRYVSHLP
jgi:hypothetical protein